MFGSVKRRERREREAQKAAERAASQRSNYMDAIQEVLRSNTELTLRVGSTKLSGHKGHCTVSDKGPWYGSEYFLRDVQGVAKRMGPRYEVVGRVNSTVARPSAGLAMDLASGYSNPRLHAMNYDPVMITVRDAGDLKAHRQALVNPDNHWISINARGRIKQK